MVLVLGLESAIGKKAALPARRQCSREVQKWLCCCFTFQAQTAEMPKPLHLSQHPPIPTGTCLLPSAVPNTSRENHKGKTTQSRLVWSHGLYLSTKRQVCDQPRRRLSSAQRVRLTRQAANQSSKQSFLPSLFIGETESQVEGLERKMLWASLSLTAFLNSAQSLQLPCKRKRHCLHFTEEEAP